MVEPDVLKKLHDFNEYRAFCISFALAMRGEYGVSVHPRTEQPCYGELRKYEESHPGDCTRPESSRPDDLDHPFPDGIPEALAIGLPDWRGGGIENNQEMFDFLLSDDSPYVRGFISSKNVEWSPNKSGFVLLDTSFDPTVLVGLLKHIQMVEHQGRFDTKRKYQPSSRKRYFTLYREHGLSLQEAFILDHSVVHDSYSLYMNRADSYVYPIFMDVGRVFDQNPQDLTGGTLRDRFDYNRKRLHELFSLEEAEGGISFHKEMSLKAGIALDRVEWDAPRISFEEMVDLFKAVYNDLMIEKRKVA